MQIVALECYADVLNFAETLGWNQTEAEDALILGENDEWTPSAADALEQDAIDFICEKGFEVAEAEDYSLSGFDINYIFISA